jgi:hypothetical protein
MSLTANAIFIALVVVTKQQNQYVTVGRVSLKPNADHPRPASLIGSLLQ